jgi:hypothetical protein
LNLASAFSFHLLIVLRFRFNITYRREGRIKNIYFIAQILLLFYVSIIFVACGKQEAEWKGIIEEIDGVKHIENPELPKYSGQDAPQLVFEKDLSIPLKGAMYSLDVSQDGTMYALAIDSGEVEVYDTFGRLLRKFGRKGQGPGEFTNPWYVSISPENEVFVLDKSTRKINVFDIQGNFERVIDCPSSLGLMNSFIFDPSGDLYFFYTLSSYRLGEKEKLSQGIVGINFLTKFNNDLEMLGEITSCNYAFIRRGKDGESGGVIYNNIFYYQVDRTGNLYYGYSDKYEIHLLSPGGKLIRTVKKRAQPIKTTKSDMDHVLKEYPGLKEFEDSLILADTKPLFSDFHLLEGIGLLVSTYENEWNEERVIFCDLFDPEGIYVAQVTVPPYFYWNHHELIAEQRNRLFRKGNCYSINYNQEGDFLELVRHRVRLISP